MRPRDEEDEDAAEYGTPTSSRFQRTAENAGYAAGVRPPLEEDAGLQAMKERFADTFDKKFLPANAKQFRPEAMTTVLRMNLQDNNLLLNSDQTSGMQPIIHVCRPAFDHTAFFRTPPDHNVDKTYSVPTKALASKMVQLGYVKVMVTHLPADERELPAAVGELVRGAQGGLSADAFPPPVELRLNAPISTRRRARRRQRRRSSSGSSSRWSCSRAGTRWSTHRCDCGRPARAATRDSSRTSRHRSRRAASSTYTSVGT